MNTLFPRFQAGLLGGFVLFLLIGARPADAQIIYWSCGADPYVGGGGTACYGYGWSEDGSAYAQANSAAVCYAENLTLGSATEGDASVGPTDEGSADVASNVYYDPSTQRIIYAYTHSTSVDYDDSYASAEADCGGFYTGYSNEYGFYTSAYANADASPS